MKPRRVIAALVTASALFAGTTAAASVRSKTATNACQLLKRAGIESVFITAVVDRGPKPVKAPTRADERFTRCEFDDHNTPEAGHALNAYTFFARDLDRAQKRLLATPQAGSTARALTDGELAGIGTKGVMEMQPGNSYASVGALKGDNYFIVSAGYEGVSPLPQISESEMLSLARLASKKA